MGLGFAPVSAEPVSGFAGVDAYTNNVSCTGKATRMLNNQVATKRKTQTQGANGSPVSVWVEHISGVCAAIQISSTFESGANMRETGETNATLYTPPGVDIISTDRVYPQKGEYANKVFEVDSPLADDAGHAAYARFSLKRLEGGGTR